MVFNCAFVNPRRRKSLKTHFFSAFRAVLDAFDIWDFLTNMLPSLRLLEKKSSTTLPLAAALWLLFVFLFIVLSSVPSRHYLPSKMESEDYLLSSTCKPKSMSTLPFHHFKSD